MTATQQRSLRPRFGLWVGPLLLIASLAVWLVADRLVIIGPFDRAQIEGLVGVPLYLLAPGALGVAAARAQDDRGRFALLLVPLVLGVLTMAALVATVGQIGCQPVVSEEQVLAPSLPVGITAALAFGIPALAAQRAAGRGAVLALALAAVLAAVGAALTVVVLLVMFPVVSCAAPA